MSRYLEIAKRVLAEQAGQQTGCMPEDKQAQVDAAVDLLNREGARILKRDGVYEIGVWKDTPEIRLALKVLNMDELPTVRLSQDRTD